MSLHSALLAVPFGLLTVAGMAEPDRVHLAGVGVEQLQQAYLECERRAGHGLLGLGDSTTCSLLYEELRVRGFGGDFQRMLAWWSAQKEQARQATAPAADEQ